LASPFCRAFTGNFLIAVAIAVVGGTGLTAAIQRRPEWRAELIELRRDRARFRRETLKDLAFYLGFIVAAGIIQGLLESAGILPES
jgi:hypothetical protein